MGGGESQNLGRDCCEFIVCLMTQQAVRSPVDIDIQEGKMEIAFHVHSELDAVTLCRWSEKHCSFFDLVGYMMKVSM
jgi:hypothetical protein